MLASLLDDPDDTAERARLLELVARVAEASGDDASTFAEARAAVNAACGPAPPTVLDPFSGSGSIPAEAQRLGLHAAASDLNPVAVIVGKALLEVPETFRNATAVRPDATDAARAGVEGLAADVLYYGQQVWRQAELRIGHLYPSAPDGSTVIAWLWARTARCPNPACGRQMPLVHSFHLTTRPGRETWVCPAPDGDGFVLGPLPGRPDPPAGTIDRRTARCVHCGGTVPLPAFREQARREGLGLRLLALVVKAARGRNYLPPDAAHEARARTAEPAWAPDTELPRRALGFGTHNYGIVRHRDLYTPRQLVALSTFADLIPAARAQVAADARRAGLGDNGVPLRAGGTGATARAEAVALYLALALDRAAARWCTFARWHRTRENIEHPFASPGLHMLWDFAEANPFSPAAGSWSDALEAVVKALRAVPAAHSPVAAAHCVQATAEVAPAPPGPVLVCTDPPYFDTLPYADMADLFYIWLRPVLRDIFPDICGTMLSPKAEELVADPHRFGGRDGAREHFRQRMEAAFRHLRAVADPRYPLTVFYAFKEGGTARSTGDGGTPAGAEGWEAVLSCLIAAGLCITGTWPLRTEHAQRLRSKDSNALASSILLVCRPRPEDAAVTTRGQWLRDLRRVLPTAVAELTAAGVPPVDLAQSALGPGMALFSHHAAVLEADGQPMTVRSALQVIGGELDAHLAGAAGQWDAASRFCTAWLQQHGFDEGPFGEADLLARTRGVGVETLARDGILSARGGRVRLLRPDQTPTSADGTLQRPSQWASLHTAIRTLQCAGARAAADAVAATGHDTAALRALARHLYALCDRTGAAVEARAYNAVVAMLDGVEPAERGGDG